jgi:Fe2+ or Zn2+ uptake regulation protein
MVLVIKSFPSFSQITYRTGYFSITPVPPSSVLQFLENDDHHDHLVDITNDEVIEFYNEEIEKLKEKIARDHGYELIGHKLELYCRPIAKKN